MGGGKGGGGSAPAPDPRIGEAALMNAELGKEWLEFAAGEAKSAGERQEVLDNLTQRIGTQQLETQDQMLGWGQQDRELAMKDRDFALEQRDKMTGWADQDRASGLADRDWALQQREAQGRLAKEDRARSNEFLEDYAQDRERSLERSEEFLGDYRSDRKLYDRFLNDYEKDRAKYGEFVEDYKGDRAEASRDKSATRQSIAAERAQAEKDRQRFDPVEEKMVKDAMEWDSKERLAEQAAQARGEVLSSADAAQQQQQREMASMGINPNSGRFQGADRLAKTQTGLAAAGAQNQARDNVRGQALGLRSNAANYGVNAAAQRSASGQRSAALTSDVARMGLQEAGMSSGMAGQSMQRAGQSASMAGQSMQRAGQSAGMVGQMGQLENQRAGQSAGMSAQLAQRGLSANADQYRAAGFGAGQYNTAMGAAGAGAQAGSMAGASQGAGVGTMGAATNVGNSVLAGQAGANQAALAPMNIMNQGYGGAMQGNTSMMNGLNTQYGNELQAWSANQQAAAQNSQGLWGGLGQLAGTAGGLYMMSSKDAKTDKQPVDGSALQAVKGMPVESWRYKEGVEDGGAQEHIGPYAEDFQESTGKGDGTAIPMQDMMGLQLKAIQELGLEVEKLKGGKKTGRRPSDIKGEYKEKVA